MTLEFIEKRIKEQCEYNAKLWVGFLRGIISNERYLILKESSYSQYYYFIEEKQKLIANEKE